MKLFTVGDLRKLLEDYGDEQPLVFSGIDQRGRSRRLPCVHSCAESPVGLTDGLPGRVTLTLRDF